MRNEEVFHLGRIKDSEKVLSIVRLGPPKTPLKLRSIILTFLFVRILNRYYLFHYSV
jgi:hypothetical protein